MNAAYFECPSGATGEMFLGAWLDLDIAEAEWRALFNELHIAAHAVIRRTVYQNGIRATKVDVNLHQYPDAESHLHGQSVSHGEHHVHHEVQHWHLPDIWQILDGSNLPEPVLQKSKAAFRELAIAAGKVHGLPIEKVDIHQVGSVDAILHIVGTMIGWYLAGMPECYVSDIETGGGSVWSERGFMPAPAPATAELLKGFRTYSSGNWGETVTPTGAAIIRTLCRPERIQGMVSTGIGYGAGTKDLNMANVLRIQLGTIGDQQPSGSGGKVEPVCVLNANIDDMSPEWAAYAAEKVLEHGALDVWWTPIVMKKGRPALQIQVLCHPEDRDRMIDLIETETTTLGVRVTETMRSILDREIVNVETCFGTVRIKVARKAGLVRNVAPEFEDCKACAEAHCVPLKAVYHEALHQYYAMTKP